MSYTTFEAQVPAFYTVTTASKHDSTAMSSIHYEPNAYYIFDRLMILLKSSIGYILQTLSLLSGPRRT